VRPERFLAIETSSPRLSLAIGDGHRVIASFTGARGWRHADTVFEGIKELLGRARWTLQSLTGVAVSTGPGSFTGIRIGLATSRALGQSLRLPVVGVSSLEVMAAGARTKAKWLAPQIDALAGHSFFGLFERNGHRTLRRDIAETMVASGRLVETLKRRIGRRPIWISPAGCYPEARVLLEISRERLKKAGPGSYRSVLPLYIRRSTAEERM